MNKQEWKEIITIADNFGEDCKRVIEEVGQERFAAIQRRLIQQSKSHAEKTNVEWVRAMWRYHDAISGRTFTERELDKVERWAFVWHCLQDQVTDQFQALSLASGVTGRNNPHVIQIGEGLAEVSRTMEMAEDAWNILDKFFEKVKELPGQLPLAIQANSKQVTDTVLGLRDGARDVSARMKRSLKVVEDLARLATVDASLATAKQKSLQNIAREIDQIETELRLRVDRGIDSGAVFMTKLLDKHARFMEENPSLCKWYCPECQWEGQLVVRQPPDGSLINVLDKRWVWKCPSCRRILAYDRKHPQFEDYKAHSIVFSHEAWDMICEGTVSLKAVARILEVAPEYIVYTAETAFGRQIPDHVKKELETYEQEGLEDYDESDVQEDEDLFPDQR
jgi:hypothetical protein